MYIDAYKSVIQKSRTLHLEGTLDSSLSSVSLSARILSTTSLGKDEPPLNTSSDNNLNMVQCNQFYCSALLNIRKFCLHLLVWVLLLRMMQIQTVPSAIIIVSCSKVLASFLRGSLDSYSFLLDLWTSTS